MPARLPGLPAPHARSTPGCATTPTRSACASGSASAPAVQRAERARRRRLGHRRRALRRAGRLQRPPLGPAPAGLPGQLRRRVDPLAPLHRHRATRSTCTASACSWSASATARSTSPSELSRKGVAERTYPVDAQRRVGDAEVHLRPPGRHSSSRPTRASRCASSGAWARCSSGCVSGKPEDFGLPDAQPPLPRGAPHRVERAAAAARARATRCAKPDVAELRGRPRPLRRRQRRGGRRHRLRDGLQHQLPVLRPGVPAAPDNVLPLYKRMFKPGLDDLAFVGLGQAIPTIFPFAELPGEAAGALRRRRLGAAAGRRDGARRSAPTRPSTSSTSPAGRATRCSSTGTSTSTTSSRARSRPGRLALGRGAAAAPASGGRRRRSRRPRRAPGRGAPAARRGRP